MKFSHTYEMELDDDEAGMEIEDFESGSVLQILFEQCGSGPVAILCRARGGERLNVPTLDYITKPSRARRRKKLARQT